MQVSPAFSSGIADVSGHLRSFRSICQFTSSGNTQGGELKELKEGVLPMPESEGRAVLDKASRAHA